MNPPIRTLKHTKSNKLSMSYTRSLPLYDKIARKYPIYRSFDVTIFFLLISLLVYRLLYLNKHGIAWLLALLCESFFTFVWVITVNCKWNPIEYKTYPKRLLQTVEELPRVDMFVTTADPTLEPPMLTVNTVISLLAVDYPADKLACYVSDDGCSPLTFYALVEASKFAKLWVPFCKKHNIQLRAPFRYFSNKTMLNDDSTLEFQQEYNMMKDEYEELSRKIRDAAQKSISWDLSGDFAVFSNIERKNHPAIIKIIWENKEGQSGGLPHLIYISREKRPKHPHHCKAGAMNVLTRVSAMLTNAPFMLNVDCDMYANNPQIVSHAMCLLLGSKNERECGFVQSPQAFYDGLKDDPFGNQYLVLHEYVIRGMGGIQGCFYEGTGCFHRRKAIYGSCPDDTGNQARSLTPVYGDLSEKELLNIFGNSKDFMKSAARALGGKANDPKSPSDFTEAAHQVAGCDFEHNTSWGKEIGWQYGSITEDDLTGLMIHSRGWKSVFFTPDPPAFLGCIATGPTLMTQQKRWATGAIQVLISKKNPILATLTTKLQFRQCLAYLWTFVWGLRCIPELCYAVLPAYCIITNSSFLPKVHGAGINIYIALVLIYVFYTVLEYIETGLSIRAWWNNQKMIRIIAINGWFFGLLSAILKILRISEAVFEVTQKDQNSSNDDSGDEGKFTFDASLIFLPGTTIVLLQFMALVMRFLGMQPSVNDGYGSGMGEILSSVLVVICFWPFVKGLLAKGKYGIPLPTICKSALVALSFVHFCSRESKSID